jgi:recombination protein RecA
MGKEKIKDLLNELEKNYNVKKAGDIEKDEVISTGLFSLDYVLSGGIHICEGGHRIEFFGAESSCKSTFALHIIKKFQQEGKTCVYIDAENSYDKEWAKLIGVDNESLIIVKPTSLEQAGDLFTKLIPQVDLIVVDSIVSMIPEEESNRDTNQPTMGLTARVNALICKKIYESISKHKTTLIFINQLREKIGVMYGSPYTTGGGHAIKHMYNTRIEFKAGEPIEENKERIGFNIKLKCVKNKKGTPYRVAEIPFKFTGELNNKLTLLMAGIRYDIITRKGAYYMYENVKSQGQEKFFEEMKETQWKAVEKEIWKRLGKL